MEKFKMYIDGEFVEAASGEWFDSFDPFTGEVWSQVAAGGPTDVNRAVEAAHRAFTQGPWSEMTASQRGMLVHKLGDLIARDAKKLAEMEVQDNGKLIAEMQGQVNYVPQWYYYFGGLADKIEGAVIPLDKKGYFNFTRHEPLGVVAAITAWNSPLLLLAWKLAPALAAGCTVVIKPSEFTSASTLEFVKLVKEAGFPNGVVNVVTGFGKDVGEPLTNHPLVRKIAFTGSDATGRAINEVAAKSFKRVTLELGGKSPQIVFEDANLDGAVEGVMLAKMRNLGEACTAANRIYVHSSIAPAFTEKFTSAMAELKIGNGLEAGIDVGPLVNSDTRNKVDAFVQDAVAKGAKVELGGVLPTGKGFFYPPTVLSGVPETADCVGDEIFGPVAALQVFNDQEDVIRRANDTEYGLVAYVFSEDMKRALQVCERLDYGMVGLNRGLVSDPAAPFGGTKQSGLGREGGHEGMHEFMETQYISASW